MLYASEGVLAPTIANHALTPDQFRELDVAWWLRIGTVRAWRDRENASRRTLPV